MKATDIERIHEAGLITAEQRDKIIGHFHLAEDGGSRFLTIISFIGAVLVSVGISLLIAAHWNEIPRGVKIGAGLALMLGAHGGGWWLRESHGKYPRTGEALQFIGSALFLANIALVGQIYHLSSRTPNAFLLWLAGIAVLPWLLRSRAQFVLLLAAFSVWFSCEINEGDSLICFDHESQILAYALLGLNFFGAGCWLRRTASANFAPVAEKLGLVGMLVFAYPLAWAGVWNWGHHDEQCQWLLPLLAVTGVLSAAWGILKNAALPRQWRWTWVGTWVVVATLLVAAFYLPKQEGWRWFGRFDAINAVATGAIFGFCLMLIQAGLHQRSGFLVNLGVTFIGLDILSSYIGLFGTMAVTGLMFLASGVFLILFGVFLEKKRRKLMRQLKDPVAEVTP